VQGVAQQPDGLGDEGENELDGPRERQANGRDGDCPIRSLPVLRLIVSGRAPVPAGRFTRLEYCYVR
jgi:hypothetical protein